MSVLLIGTSLTVHVEDVPAAFAGAGLPRPPFNAGVGGDWIADILNRLENLRLLDAWVGTPPWLVVLEGGVNDLAEEEVNLDLLACGTEQCMDCIWARFPEAHISLLGAFPRGGRSAVSDAEMLGRVAGLNQRLEQLVAARQQRQPSCSCSFDGRAADWLEGGGRQLRLYKVEVLFSPDGNRMFANLLVNIMQQHVPL